jgi:ATP-dependent Clp protease, protease subunit
MQRTIVEERAKNIAVMDVFSKLIQERIIFIDGPIDDDLTNGVIAQMLYLNSLNSEKTIQVYINSPGGGVLNGLAIYDISKLIKAPIRTVCVGQAVSMAAILMLMGKERCGLKHSRMMLHQVQGGAIGTTQDIKITAVEVEKLEKELYKIVEENTTLEDIERLFYFDKWFTAEEALECGLLTSIL